MDTTPAGRRLQALLLDGTKGQRAREILMDSGWDIDMDGDFADPRGLRLVCSPTGRAPTEANIYSAVEMLERLDASLGRRLKNALGGLMRFAGLTRWADRLQGRTSLRLVGGFNQE